MSYSDLSDKDLISICAQGDLEAGDYFVEKYSGLIFKSIHKTADRCCANLSGEDIEDLHGDIFRSLWSDDHRKLKQFRGDNNSTVATWLMVIAANSTRNFISRRKEHDSLDDKPENGRSRLDELFDQQTSVLKALIEAERIKILEKLIDALKPGEKLIIEYHLEGLSTQEISTIMNKSANAVYTDISRIRKKLKELLGKGKIVSGIQP